jgi:hypothetical protein
MGITPNANRQIELTVSTEPHNPVIQAPTGIFRGLDKFSVGFPGTASIVFVES